MLRAALAVVSLSALLLSGCATTTAIEGEAIDDRTTHDLSALMEAPDRMRLECTSTEPLSTQRTLHELVFSCPEMKVKASLAELHDAGWRLMSVDVGQETHREDGLLGLPLTINVIKLF